MSIRTLLMSAMVGLVAVAVSGCVSDPYYGYDGYGPYYDGYGPYNGGMYGGYYAGSAIIYGSGPRAHYRPRYVDPRPYRPHRVYREHRPSHAHRPHRQFRQPAHEIRRDSRPRQAAPVPRRDELRQTRDRRGMNRQDWRATRAQDRPEDGRPHRRHAR